MGELGPMARVQMGDTTMQRCAMTWTLSVLLIASAATAFGATVDEKGQNWTITTDQYTIVWNVDAQGGYSSIIPVGNDDTDMFGAGGRNLYHSANYAGWKDWGATADADIIEEDGGKIVMSFVQEDGASKNYHVTATYWDGVPYWKHELTVEAVADVTSFSDGHEPMVEPRNGFGLDNEYEKWDAPFAHAAFANDSGYFAIYTEEGTARTHAWQDDGRMDLEHNNLGVALNADDFSDPITYYMATAVGDLDDAHDLAEIVTKEPAEVLAVSAKGKLTTSWGDLRAR
ncbi:hypothetical protein CMK11_05435 [Candidatus Poribacteria bacterium]|nr:hypothetical protein [Candidatus Poribacteria bacterium]